MFVPGQLTRQVGVDPRALTFAVVALETTGLYPRRGSRICEVAVVRMRGDGMVLDEYSTLVNPGVRITNDEFHGITNADVTHAPTFDQIAGDLLAYLNEAIVVSHHLEFADRFLSAGFSRLGVTLPQVPGLCSLVTARTQLDRSGYKLDNVANLLTGQWPPALPSALGAARALASALAKLIGEPPEPLYWRGTPGAPLPALPRTGFITPRAVGLRRGAEGWLATLIARLPYMAHPPQPRPEALRDYHSLLTYALADGRIVGDEANQLAVLAGRAGLTRATAQQAHEQFLVEARARAEADGVVTSTELRELRRAAKELSASYLINDLEESAAATRARSNGALKGWRILPVGNAPHINDVIEYAVENGARVAVNVTKTVRVLVVAGAAVDDPRIVKAHATGVDILSPEQARELFEGEVVKAHTKLFADSSGEQIANRLAAEQADAVDGVRPEWHEFWRPRELTTAEYRKQFVKGRDDWDDAREMRAPGARKVSAAAAKGGCAVVALLGSGAVVGLVELVRRLFS